MPGQRAIVLAGPSSRYLLPLPMCATLADRRSLSFRIGSFEVHKTFVDSAPACVAGPALLGGIQRIAAHPGGRFGQHRRR